MNQSAMIQVRALCHTYERWGLRTSALRDVRLDVRGGEWVALTGANGSGKSTLLKLLAGLLPVQTGEVQIAGQPWAGMPMRRRASLVYLVHQDPMAGTAPALTVGEHLALAAPPADGSAAAKSRELQRPQAQGEFLEAMKLDVAPSQLVATLSGGQRQLLALLVASLRPAPVILLDEPMAALDADRTEACAHTLRMLHSSGRTLLLVTHDVGFAQSSADRTIRLEAGCIALDQTHTQPSVSDVTPLRQSRHPAVPATQVF